jgi:predicted enzyme related to lactoylglutathione lyase
MVGNPIGWFEIYVDDMARACAFYEAVFGGALTPMTNPDPDAFEQMDMAAFPSSMESYGAAGALVKMPGFSPGGNSVLVYFSCEDCAVEAGRATAAGGSVFKEKVSIGEHGFMALVIDTEGNMIGLHSMQ